MNRIIYLVIGVLIIVTTAVILRWTALPCVVKKDFTSSWFESRYFLNPYFLDDFDSLYKVTIYKGFFRPVKKIKEREKLHALKAALKNTLEQPGLSGDDGEKMFIYNYKKEIIALGARFDREWLIRTKEGVFKLDNDFLRKLN